MRFTVTALGAMGQGALDAVVNQISDYINGPHASATDDEPVDNGDPQRSQDDDGPIPDDRSDRPGRPGACHADRANGHPGWWLGLGAADSA